MLEWIKFILFSVGFLYLFSLLLVYTFGGIFGIMDDYVESKGYWKK